MEEIAKLLRELIDKVSDANFQLADIAVRLEEIATVESIDQVVSALGEMSLDVTNKLEEVSSNITGPSNFNLEDIWKELIERS